MNKVKLAARSLVREVDFDTAEKLLLSGSFVRVIGHDRMTVKQQKAERRQRRHALARRARGWQAMVVWLPPGLRDAFKAERRKGETIAGQLARLLAMAEASSAESRTHGQTSIVDAHAERHDDDQHVDDHDALLDRGSPKP